MDSVAPTASARQPPPILLSGAWPRLLQQAAAPWLACLAACRPLQCMRPRQEDVTVQVAGVSVHLLAPPGACLGAEVNSASDSIPCGSVVLGSQGILASEAPRAPCVD